MGAGGGSTALGSECPSRLTRQAPAALPAPQSLRQRHGWSIDARLLAVAIGMEEAVGADAGSSPPCSRRPWRRIPKLAAGLNSLGFFAGAAAVAAAAALVRGLRPG